MSSTIPADEGPVIRDRLTSADTEVALGGNSARCAFGARIRLSVNEAGEVALR
jgi:hypothetical protein